MLKLLRGLFFVALLAVVGAAGVVAYAWWRLDQPLTLAQEPIDYTLKPGTGMRQAARELQAAGVGVQPDLLAAYARVLGLSSKLKAGSYEFKGPLTARELLEKVARGEVTMQSVTLVEGWTFKQFRAALARNEHVAQDTRGLDDMAVAKLVSAEIAHPEGQFFADTYLFSKGTKDIDILKRAHRAMQRQLAEAWAARVEGLPYKSPYEALIMASIVEKETGKASERAQIAGVFVNRLRKGMLLQTDPTVIYGMGAAFDGNIRKRDLQTDTPYNTYTRGGLPPTPIAMPGVASLAAAMNPATTRAVYFVARGDGSSEFSETLEAHNRAVNKYQRGK
jgi:UPF0755 protein